MTIVTVKIVMAAAAVGGHGAGFHAVQGDIAQRMISGAGDFPAEMAIGAKRQLQVTFPAGSLVLARAFGVMLDVAELVILGPDFCFVGMA
ncbi:MAG TPA: hypothetical protein ENI90_09530 [Methylothermaceae bacterium]|nr:hypothetical protein [Methylothermaceae bacterium]